MSTKFEELVSSYQEVIKKKREADDKKIICRKLKSIEQLFSSDLIQLLNLELRVNTPTIGRFQGQKIWIETTNNVSFLRVRVDSYALSENVRDDDEFAEYLAKCIENPSPKPKVQTCGNRSAFGDGDLTTSMTLHQYYVGQALTRHLSASEAVSLADSAIDLLDEREKEREAEVSTLESLELAGFFTAQDVRAWAEDLKLEEKGQDDETPF